MKPGFCRFLKYVHDKYKVYVNHQRVMSTVYDSGTTSNYGMNNDDFILTDEQ